MKYLVAVALLLLLASCQARTLIVDPSGAGDAKTLISAVTMARAGDSILLKPGSYEGARIDRSLNISSSDQSQVEGTLLVTAPGCRIAGLSVTGNGRDPAIWLQSEDNVLTRCAVSGTAFGVRMEGSNNTMRQCQLEISPGFGLELTGEGCEVLESVFRGDVGVRMNGTHDSLIRGCQFSALQGVQADAATACRVENCSFSGNGFGIVLSRTTASQVLRNNLSGEFVSGIDVVDSWENNISKNFISGGKVGISLRRAQGNNITENVCRGNERAGIYGDGSVYNYLAHNRLLASGNGILLSSCRENGLLSNNASQNTYGISLRGSLQNALRGNWLFLNANNLRVDTGEYSSAPSSASSHDFFVQDIDESNLADGKPIRYLVGEKDATVSPACGFLAIISCRNITARDLAVSNSSVGILVVNSTIGRVENCSIARADSGISLIDCTSWTILASQARDCQTGFRSAGSAGCRFEGDQASNCTREGFRAENALNMAWQGCRAVSSAVGIHLQGSRLCRVQNCSVDECEEAGIKLSGSHKCQVNGNTARANGRGISLSGSNACALWNNTVRRNQGDGIALEQLSGADVQGNDAQGNGQGIFLQSSRSSTIEGNVISNNSRYGLRMSGVLDSNITDNQLSNNQIAGANLVDCKGNFLYHNVFLKNAIQNAADNGSNHWDAGPEIGGNYWGDHEVLGNPGTSPRQIPTKGVDRYPFQDPAGWR